MPGHKRNKEPSLHSPRCGAKTRTGGPCTSPTVQGKRRCSIHGGAHGSGAPTGNTNAFKTGLHTAEMRVFAKTLRETMRDCKRTLEKMGI